MNDFLSIRFGLLVGIGDGSAHEEGNCHDIRFGDMVINKPTASFGGVVQGKHSTGGGFERTNVGEASSIPPDEHGKSSSRPSNEDIASSAIFILYTAAVSGDGGGILVARRLARSLVSGLTPLRYTDTNDRRLPPPEPATSKPSIKAQIRRRCSASTFDWKTSPVASRSLQAGGALLTTLSSGARYCGRQPGRAVQAAAA
ncbi:uncharacterized protein Z518_11273 [Rhinocladiella mackenziei CBS 650.93]|uniref:Uncharacterized protein n=1 Tax=Rhinocladiella mackenziei CBS 650.93 TaxID=1442369 RepID=A0A0D2IS51_9EURO|nr:uncharacterized protein Z518_11273 [Rhinocladiella mackenziei CBS 650.93]KIW99534.1 hypothetical protein Z518_11273 [Rhinocladiella mackenziei CBS 650.93]